MKTFIQIAEVWTPTADRTRLSTTTVCTARIDTSRRISRALCFGYGEGLPGKAWAARQPVLTKDLQVDWFRRADEAAESGLACAIAIPVFAGEFLLAVLVFFCGDDNGHVGAIESGATIPRSRPA